MKTKLAMLIATGAMACAATGAADALPGRIEYAVNLGKTTAQVGRFLPVGSTYWQEGKAWNQIKDADVTAAAGYEDMSAIYKTYVYPNDATEGLSTTYILPGLEANSAYTLRLHLCEVYFQWPDCRKFDVTVNGETKVSSLDIFVRSGNEKLKGAYMDIPVVADAEGRLTIAFVNVKNQFNVAALEVFSNSSSLPVPSPKIRREARGVNVLTIETRNAAYLYDVEYRTGSGAAATLKTAIPGLRLVHTSGKARSQYRVRSVLDGTRGEWSEWVGVDSSARASDEAIYIACAEAGQSAPDGWAKDAPFRVFPSGSELGYYYNWKDSYWSDNTVTAFDLTGYDESDRPPDTIFGLALHSTSNLAYRATGLDPARPYRIRIHQMEVWGAVNSGAWRYFAYHFNNTLDKAAALTGETQIDPYLLAGATYKGVAIDYEVTPDSAGSILIAAENLKDVPYWFGFEIHPLGSVVDPPPEGLIITVK